MKRFVAVLVLCTYIPCYVLGQTNDWHQGRYKHPIAAATVGAASGIVVPLHYDTTEQLSYLHGAGRYTDFKGALGERVLEGMLLGEGKWTRLQPVRVMRVNGKLVPLMPGTRSRTGLDGTYVRWDNRGNPRGVLITESKAFGGTLARSKATGELQFSLRYRMEHLRASSEYYQRVARIFSNGEALRSNARPPADAIRLPLGRRATVTIWHDASGERWYYTADRPLSSQEVGTKLRAVARVLDGAARGVIPHRARLYHFAIRSDNTCVLRVIDADTGSRRIVVNGKYEQLPAYFQRVIRKAWVASAQEALRARNPRASEAELTKFAEKLFNRAVAQNKLRHYTDMLRPSPRWNWRIGVAPALIAGVFGGVVAGAIDAVVQYFIVHDINWERTWLTAGLGAGSALGGAWVGSQVQYLLMTSTARELMNKVAITVAGQTLSENASRALAQFVGGAAGGIVASFIFAYGAYFLGMSDLRTANRSAVAGAAGAVAASAATAGTLFLVASYGTASTGTAIASLSGAAATKASLAWLGGGAVAAGGGGVLGGTIILTGGAIIVALLVSAGVMYLFYLGDSSANIERVARLAATVHDYYLERARSLSTMPPTTNRVQYILVPVPGRSAL